MTIFSGPSKEAFPLSSISFAIPKFDVLFLWQEKGWPKTTKLPLLKSPLPPQNNKIVDMI